MDMLKNKLAKVREQAKNNKGFTLVELIVVIVILAILIGVSVSGYTKYIGQSRLNTDIQNAETLRTAFVNAQAEPGVYEELYDKNNAGKTLVLTVSNSGTDAAFSGTGATTLTKYTAAIKKALGDNWAKTYTQYTGGVFTVTATVPAEADLNGAATVTVAGTAGYSTNAGILAPTTPAAGG